MSDVIARARKLRHNQTPAEQKIWEYLRNRNLGVKFRRQVPIGPFVVDFACLDLKLVVEIDGGDHAENKRDLARTKYLEDMKFTVVRYWNNDVLANVEGVAKELAAVITARRAKN